MNRLWSDKCILLSGYAGIEFSLYLLKYVYIGCINLGGEAFFLNVYEVLYVLEIFLF